VTQEEWCYRLEGVGGKTFKSKLIWDSTFDRSTSVFSSVVPVRLEVLRTSTRWSVGTSRFLTAGHDKYKFIRGIRVAASLAAGGPRHGIVRWDSIELTLIERDGHSETLTATCLPAAFSRRDARRAIAAELKEGKHDRRVAQVAQFLIEGDVVELQLRGQVTLEANNMYGERDVLKHGDLSGRVDVYTTEKPPPKIDPKDCLPPSNPEVVD
jgi:hypothetical protein